MLNFLFRNLNAMICILYKTIIYQTCDLNNHQGHRRCYRLKMTRVQKSYFDLPNHILAHRVYDTWLLI